MSRQPAAIELSTRAAREARRLERDTRTRVEQALELLATDAANRDVKSITGHPPWKRLRAGNHRILFREITSADGPHRFLIGRIVDRRDLRRAIDSLD